MDEFGVLGRLIYDTNVPGNAEGIARVLGMVHLYRASGVHLLAFFTFLNAVVFWTLKNLGVKIKAAKPISLILIGVSILWIWKLQDFRLTLIRPVLTFLIRQFFKERGAKARIAVPLLLTFISENVLSPGTSLTEGALHYYLSVAGGLFAYHLKPEAPSLKRHLYLAIGSWLPVALISLLRDHEVSYLTPLYSLVSLPVISVFLYPLTLLDILFHHQISPLTVSLWDVFLKILFWLPDQGPSFSVVAYPALFSALPFALMFGVFWKRLWRWKILFAFCALFSISFGRQITHFFEPFAEVVQLDVHQGDGSLMKKGERVEMVDVGSLKAYAPDAWILKLSKLGVKSVDAVLFSHLDEDHIGAIKELSLLMPIHCIETNAAHWRSEKGYRLQGWLRENVPTIQEASTGCIRLSEIAWFQSGREGSAGNELMGGIVFAPNDHEAYFALGDGDEEQELKYEKRFQNQINSHPVRIWKVGHHGSRFSSSTAFLERLAPEEFWISAGKKNPYHHPHPLTLMKLARLGGKVYRTDTGGDITRSFKE